MLRRLRIPCLPALLFATAVATAVATGAATVNVPADQPTIQAGVDAAADGDTVLIAPGTYPEAVVIANRADLVLQGSGCQVTIIQAPATGPAIRIDTSARVDITGLRLSSDIVGGDNFDNGAIRIFESNAIRVFQNLITGHDANGIVLYGSEIEVFNNVIARNGDDGIRVDGGNSINPNTALIYNNTIADNVGGSGVGVWVARDIDTVTVFNNILWENDFNLAIGASANIAHDFNLVTSTRTNYNGGLVRAANEPDCDPQFIDPAALDYHIFNFSCADNTGTPSFRGYPAADIDKDGEPRPSGPGFEIGADEVFEMILAVVFDRVEASWAATTGSPQVVVRFETSAETGSRGFAIERAAGADVPFAEVGRVRAAGHGYPYEFLDTGVVASPAPRYRIVELTDAGRGDVSPTVEVGGARRTVPHAAGLRSRSARSTGH